MPIRNPAAPVGLPTTPQNLNASASDFPGSINLAWDSVPGPYSDEAVKRVPSREKLKR